MEQGAVPVCRRCGASFAGLGADLGLRGEAKQVPAAGLHGAGLLGLGARPPLEHAAQGERDVKGRGRMAEETKRERDVTHFITQKNQVMERNDCQIPDGPPIQCTAGS